MKNIIGAAQPNPPPEVQFLVVDEADAVPGVGDEADEDGLGDAEPAVVVGVGAPARGVARSEPAVFTNSPHCAKRRGAKQVAVWSARGASARILPSRCAVLPDGRCQITGGLSWP